MSGPQPTLSLDELRHGARAVAERRRDARRDYERYSEQAADADREFAVTLSKTFTKRRLEGESVGAAEIAAKAEAADAKHKRDIAHSLAKSALLRIDECEREASTLRTIGDWSRAIDGGTA